MATRTHACLAAALTLALIPALAGTAVAGGKKKAHPAKAAAEPPPEGPPPADSSPLADLKKSNSQLMKVLSKRTAAWSPESEAKRADVRKVVDEFLDYRELAQRALARHWEGIPAKDREEFVDTLRQLVERSYLDQVHSSPKYEITFDREEKKDSEANVWATLNTERKKKKVTMALEYRVVWKSGGWRVYDIVTDEQSLLENYRAEFNKVIAKESFAALLSKMKKKLGERPAQPAIEKK